MNEFVSFSVRVDAIVFPCYRFLGSLGVDSLDLSSSQHSCIICPRVRWNHISKEVFDSLICSVFA